MKEGKTTGFFVKCLGYYERYRVKFEPTLINTTTFERSFNFTYDSRLHVHFCCDLKERQSASETLPLIKENVWADRPGSRDKKKRSLYPFKTVLTVRIKLGHPFRPKALRLRENQ